MSLAVFGLASTTIINLKILTAKKINAIMAAAVIIILKTVLPVTAVFSG